MKIIDYLNELPFPLKEWAILNLSTYSDLEVEVETINAREFLRSAFIFETTPQKHTSGKNLQKIIK